MDDALYLDLAEQTGSGANDGQASGTPTLRTSTLLIVDDSRIDRSQIIFAAKRSGLNLRILEASSLKAAMDVIETSRPDIATVDFCMTDGCGVDAVEALRRCGTRAVVGVSGSDDPTVDRAMRAAGASMFLNKSDITPERLRAAIEHAMGQGPAAQDVKIALSEFDLLILDLVRELNQADTADLANDILKRCASLDYALESAHYAEAREIAAEISRNAGRIRDAIAKPK